MSGDGEGDGKGPLKPRENPDLWGHEKAERQFLSALQQGRLAHGWLLTGPRGIGKATLAYRIARYLLGGHNDSLDLLGEPPRTLSVAPDDITFSRVAAGGHPDLAVLQRETSPTTGRLSAHITVDQVRRLAERFTYTSGGGGWRVAIIDCAEDMNVNAANALLKLLEEPPPRSLIILVCHAPGRLLPTIRSRCRRLALRPLSADLVSRVMAAHRPDMAPETMDGLAQLADGSPGRALALAAVDGLDVYAGIQSLLGGLPKIDFSTAHELGDRLARRGQDAAYEAWIDLFTLALSRLVRLGAAPAAGDADSIERRTGQHLMRLAPLDHWVELWEKVGALAARAESVNLDKKQVIFNTFVMLEATARRARA